MNQRIYILEDDPDIGMVLQYFLIEEGFEVVLFASVEDCQLALSTKLPDLCLFDIMLPDGDGITICNRIKHGSNPELPVILCLQAKTRPVLMRNRMLTSSFQNHLI
jgi:DNA-binding response OmpR family regulator